MGTSTSHAYLVEHPTNTNNCFLTFHPVGSGYKQSHEKLLFPLTLETENDGYTEGREVGYSNSQSFLIHRPLTWLQYHVFDMITGFM